MSKILGIDLGTTNSAVAVIENGEPTLIPVDGKPTMPSVVGTSNGELLVGTPARNQWVVAPEDTILSIKRKMGSREKVTMGGKKYTSQEISAFILKKLKEAAESYKGEKFEKVVITVPAYFNEVQRQATLEAGEIAGFKVERIINEPTAAALAYGMDKVEDLKVLAYDLGGGTFDVSVIDLSEGVVDVRATAGDNHLGGDDIDRLLAEMLAEEFAEEHGIDLKNQRQAWARLIRASEEAKIALSNEAYTKVILEFLAEKDGTPLNLNREVSRRELEEISSELLERTLDLVDKALKDAELEVDDIDHVLLVGGSTRMPAIWEETKEKLKQDPRLEIDPDAVVALGAAVQGGIIAGDNVDAILVDVTPLSLGVETAHFVRGKLRSDNFDPLIHRNSTIPIQKSKTYTTLYPGQDKIHTQVYQGEERIASKNTLLGEFMVENLTPNRRDGLTDVTINFNLDVSGILEVTVKQYGDKKKTTQTLQATRQRLSTDELNQSRARLEALSTTTQKDSIVLDEQTQALIDRAKETLDNPDLTSDLASSIAGTIADIRQAAKEGDQEGVEQSSDDLADLLLEAEE